MTASTASSRGAFGRRARMLILGAMLACLGVFAFSGAAKAAAFSTDITNGQLNLGFAFKGAEILPAPDRIPADNPTANLPDLWEARDTTEFANPTSAAGFGCLTPVKMNFTTSPPTPTATPNPTYPCGPNPDKGTISGDLTGSDVTIMGSVDGGPANQWGLPNGFRFPIMVVPNPLDNSPVPITLAATGNVTGTFDSATGDLSLSGPIEARVLVGLETNPLGEYCAVPLEGLTLSTTSNADFPGVPYTSGIGGQGALTGTYNITQNSTSVGGADCGTVDQVSKGAGSIWLSNGIAEPPVCPENTTGIPPDCEPIPCPAGYTGNEPDCVKLKGKIGKLKLNAPKKVKSGKKFKVRAKVSNTGNAKLTNVRICLKTQKKKIKGSGKRCHVLSALAAGKTKQVRFGLKSKRFKKKTKTKLRAVVSKNGKVLRKGHVTVLTR